MKNILLIGIAVIIYMVQYSNGTPYWTYNNQGNIIGADDEHCVFYDSKQTAASVIGKIGIQNVMGVYRFTIPEDINERQIENIEIERMKVRSVIMIEDE